MATTDVYYFKRLPANFPDRVQVNLREQVYDYRREIFSYFRFDGDRFKVVVDTESAEVVPQPGEKWELAPVHSPNGHVVFCRPMRRLRPAQ